MVVVLALVLVILGCGCIYLASPHQKWLAHALPRRPAVLAGSVLL